MKISLALALLAPLTLPLIAHAQTGDMPDAVAPETPMLAPIPLAPKSAATADAFVWRFVPPVGSRWTMRSFVRASSDTKVPAMGGNKAESVKFASMQKMTADYDIISRDALGATTIRLTLREMSNDMTFMSDGKTTKTPLAAADPKAVNGATLTIKQASDGKVWGVVGMRAFQRKILEASGSFDAATIDQLLDASPMNANNGMFKSFSQMSGGLPVSPIRVGESWNYDVSLPAQLPMSFDITGTRTLKKLDDDSAVVADSAHLGGGNSQMKIPNVGATKMPTVDFSRLVGVMSGTTRVQRSSGLPLEATANLSMSGSVSTQMPATGNEKSQTITVPMNLTSATRVVLEPR